MLLAIQAGLTARDNRSDWYDEDKRVGVRIMISIMLSW
jgi:hypothetical protein